MYFWYYLQFFHFDLEKFTSKNCKYIFSTRNLYISAENTSKYCSPIIVVHVHATVFFLKFTQPVTILQTVSKQEVTLERLISMLWIAQKLFVGG